ncbi:EI24 domain-containing protein [Cellulophaga baltica]|uniref:EI24 domain-containing protein n=1 Tax=Cellulophaga TaxID=104264 RepID=UPI001C073AEA|nr:MULTISPECIES: EI24 domain-containing protein [Cellulophaga]MBU2997600.1 EI24 domain-containing protein [Cellulophaga baltica]MDO6768995.1 EI24 domain-containing protein [Cellulophaga sp. 1_MG-2023]
MIKNILIGIKSYGGSLKLISELKLWNYFYIPVVISLITAVIIGFAAFSLSTPIGNFIANIWVWGYGKDIFISFSTVIGAILVLIIGLIVYKHIILALSAPFMSPVSEKIEKHILGTDIHSHTNSNFSEQLWRGIKINARNLGKELLYTIPLLLLKFIPIVNIFSTIAVFLVQAYYAGFGGMDYTLERHLNYKESILFVKKNRGIAIGNGIVFMLFLLIPVIGILIVLPLSVTAASKKTISILNSNNNSNLLNIK